MTDTAIPSAQNTEAATPKEPQVVCRRCGLPGPVNDDGFCDPCEKALEQACL